MHARSVQPRGSVPVALAVALIAVALLAGGCGGKSLPAPLSAAGGELDDGTGLLYRASIKYETGTGTEPEGFADDTAAPSVPSDEYGGFVYGGGTYGGSPYGGASYGTWQGNYSTQPANRQPSYAIESLADAGAVSGTVRWSTVPAHRRVRSPCGEIDNPTLRVGAHGEAAGAIVYLDQILAGRPYAMGQNRLLVVGGTLEKRGCALLPAAQVVSPVPTAVTVFNDAERVTAVARTAGAEPVVAPLAPGGFAQLGIAAGVTVVADEPGRLVPAWIVAPGHPYFAITDDAGRFRIDDVVPGTYKLVIWHPPVVSGWVNGKVQYGAATVVTRTIKVTASGTAKLDVALP